ncbi:HIG1 domain member 1A, mitochondrial [Blomia tropicalis]|nr:HIG1 domain member 1A, mitochondrial [Blomia tropicalis]
MNQPPQPSQAFFVPSTNNLSYGDDENRILKKIKESPTTLGFLGVGGYRIYKARSRGGLKLSLFLIHTRLAAQGLAVGVLGSLVLYSLGERFYKNVWKENSTDNGKGSSN